MNTTTTTTHIAKILLLLGFMVQSAFGQMFPNTSFIQPCQDSYTISCGRCMTIETFPDINTTTAYWTGWNISAKCNKCQNGYYPENNQPLTDRQVSDNKLSIGIYCRVPGYSDKTQTITFSAVFSTLGFYLLAIICRCLCEDCGTGLCVCLGLRKNPNRTVFIQQAPLQTQMQPVFLAPNQINQPNMPPNYYHPYPQQHPNMGYMAPMATYAPQPYTPGSVNQNVTGRITS